MANETLHAPAIEAVAMAKHVRMSPQKIRLVVDMIRGRRAEDALQILRFTMKRASRDVEKVLRSAIANAERKAEDAGVARCRPFVCLELLRERRLALEEAAPRAHGPRLSLPAPHRPHRRRRRRASCGRAAARRCRGCGSRIAEGRGRGRQEGSPGS